MKDTVVDILYNFILLKKYTHSFQPSSDSDCSDLRPIQLLNIVLCTYVCSKGRGHIRKKVFSLD